MEYPKIDDEFLQKRPLSYSSLKAFRKSPKHYLEYLTDVRIPTDAMMLGGVTEKLLLYTKEEFDAEYMVYQLENSKTTKAGKEEFAKIIESANINRRTLITKEIYETAKTIVESLRSFKELEPYLNVRNRRTMLKWTDTKTNLPIIGYTDWDTKVGRDLFVCDLKVSKSADPDDFNKAAWNYDYHIQVGSYLEGYRRTRFAFPYFLFVVVESAPPFNVSLMFVDNKYMQYCRDEFLGSLKAFRYCMDNGLFYQGYEFRLMRLMSYFSLTKPGWGKVKFGEFNDDSNG